MTPIALETKNEAMLKFLGALFSEQDWIDLRAFKANENGPANPLIVRFGDQGKIEQFLNQNAHSTFILVLRLVDQMQTAKPKTSRQAV